MPERLNFSLQSDKSDRLLVLKLRFHPDVAIDIRDSFNWYEDQSEGLGEELLAEIENGYDAIIDFPKTWSPFRYGFRRFLLSRFPYSIIYRTDEDILQLCTIVADRITGCNVYIHKGTYNALSPHQQIIRSFERTGRSEMCVKKYAGLTG